MTRLLLVIGLLTAWAPPAGAQDTPRPIGTLARIQATGTITLGVRDSALPFSYRLADGSPAGYAVDLCKALTDDVSAALNRQPIRIAYKTVTAEDRIDKVASGDVDIECGSTTRNKQRLERVAFSPVFFIAGTKLLVSRESPILSYKDLRGKTVVVTSGTTNETAMHVLVERLVVHTTIVTAPNHTESFAMLRAGQADAFATDDVLLAGLAATYDGQDYHVVGDYLSYEPYGLMYRKDEPAFAAVVEHGFRRLAEAGRLADMYNRWLVRRLPTGEKLNIPMSAELAELFRELGQPD
nr:amino acid ABC transporter substrate-binding protein [uncultured Rhodopila sp.]